MGDRQTTITLGGKGRAALLTVRAAKTLTERFGGIDRALEKITHECDEQKKKEALAYIIWVLICEGEKSRACSAGRECSGEIAYKYAEDEVEKDQDLGFLTFQAAAALSEGAKRYVLTDAEKKAIADDKERRELGVEDKEQTDDMFSDPEARFALLVFIGTTLLGRNEREVWSMPLGALMDQYAIYKMYHGLDRASQSEEATAEMFDGIM